MLVENIQINKIKKLDNHRTREDDVSSLMSSIQLHGLLQPVGVRKEKKKYIYLYGDRRIRACENLGHKTIAAVIIEGKEKISYADDAKNLIENLQRSNPTTFDEGRYYEKLINKGLTIKEISTLLSIGTPRIKTAFKVYKIIPLKFRKCVIYTKGKRLGNIGASQVSEIVSATTAYNLPSKDKHKLFELCRDTRNFSKKKIFSTAAAMSRGVKDPLKSLDKTTVIRLPLSLSSKKIKLWNALNPELHIKDFIMTEVKKNKKIIQLM